MVQNMYTDGELHTSLIKSGGGNGPMKPGNLLFIKVPNPAAKRKMRIRLTHIESSVCGFFVAKNRK